jgi:hypothetical protein
LRRKEANTAEHWVIFLALWVGMDLEVIAVVSRNMKEMFDETGQVGSVPGVVNVLVVNHDSCGNSR